MGLKLFDRSLRQVVPTLEGAAIIARLVLEAAEQLKTLARAWQNPMQGRLRLGVIQTLGPYSIPHWMTALRTQYPELLLLLKENLTEHLL